MNVAGGVQDGKLLSRLVQNMVQLSHMKLDGTPLETLRAILSALPANTPLQELIITNTPLESEGSCAIMSLLEKNTSLTTLTIKNSTLLADGAMMIATALTRNSTLVELGLSNNKIGDLGAEEILNVLFTNGSLERISLTENDITGNIAHQVAALLRRNSNITKIDLSGNEKWDESTLEMFSSIIEANSTLTQFNPRERWIVVSYLIDIISACLKANEGYLEERELCLGWPGTHYQLPFEMLLVIEECLPVFAQFCVPKEILSHLTHWVLLLGTHIDFKERKSMIRKYSNHFK
uniref:Uncharacterized protein n=1 Tax=Arcella intermedia TaxID=1963864 RepID=A0A6B2LC79_9EUKA